MQIVNLSRNDTLSSIVQKCNLNFKELAFATNQSIRKSTRISDETIIDDVGRMIGDLTTTTIPNEVSAQLTAADIPGQVSSDVSAAITASDIPGLVSAEVASQIVTDYTDTVSDFLTADTSDVVIVNGMAHKWGKMAKISLTYRFVSPYVVMSDGKINNLQLGTLTSDWMTIGGLTNVSLDATRKIEGVIDSTGLITFMSANSRGTSYTIDENAVLYAGFTYMLA